MVHVERIHPRSIRYEDLAADPSRVAWDVLAFLGLRLPPRHTARPLHRRLADQVFIALADPTRRSILAALATEGPATATDLVARLPITRQAIAKHLALMAETGLVTPEPGERRRIRYRLQSAPVQLAQQYLAALAHDWDDRLDALQQYLATP